MLDYLIRNASVIDGTGEPARQADVGIRDGRIASVGEVDDEAAEVIDATGLVLCPGFVDPHTHYDAQLLWDPFASPSNIHGVTTTISGNCGFTLAPLKADDVQWTLEMLAEVEGMPLAALTEGVGGGWTSFAEYLDQLDGKLGINAAFLVGHCALRRFVMGAEGTENEASPEQLDAMKTELRAALEAGGLGFSSSQSFTHDDGDGRPVPSRVATTDEVLALAQVVSEYEGTTLEYITDGCLKGFTDEEIERLTAMSLAANRPLNWNVLTVDSNDPGQVERQLEASTYAAEHGARVVALTMPILVPMNMSFLTRCALTLIPYWDEILTLPVAERMEKLRDPEIRRRMDEAIHSEAAGVFQRFNRYADYEIGDTFSEENRPLEGRKVGDIAAEWGKKPFDTLLDIVLADELKTVIWPKPLEGDDASWKMRMELIDSERAMVGGSDGGAHLDRMLGSIYPTVFLADMIRRRKLLSIERTVQLMTDVPARLFGLRERGRVVPGWHADLVLFDPEEIGASKVRLATDLPADSARLFSQAKGIHRVWVNGRVTVVDNESTGELAGTLLRSGRDTETVSVPAGAVAAT
ncbi:MAG: amidohydrolase family protein [Acidimicrobiia bacterium]|nr:amidohydrolase family protein [Acidimicrobiia bacterium]